MRTRSEPSHLVVHLEGPGQSMDLGVWVTSTDLGRRWRDELAGALRQKLVLEKNYSLLGVATQQRPLAKLESDLRLALRLAGEWYQLDWVLAISSAQDLLSQHSLNAAHHAFEVCIGQVWAPNPAYVRAPSRVQFAVRSINNLVHEIEARQRSIQPGSPLPTLIASFLRCARHELLPSDQPDFRLCSAFGDLYLHYCQLGKTHLEVLHDGDESIAAENISELRFWSCEFDLFLGETEPRAVLADRQLRAQAGPNDIGVGRVLIGRLASVDGRTPERSEVVARLSTLDYGIARISVLTTAGRWVTGHFPYDAQQAETLSRANGSRNPLRRWAARQASGIWYDHRHL